MVADNVHLATDVDESKYPYDPADDWYDMDIVSTSTKCKICDAFVIFHASGHVSCSNEKCESHHVKIDC